MWIDPRTGERDAAQAAEAYSRAAGATTNAGTGEGAVHNAARHVTTGFTRPAPSGTRCLVDYARAASGLPVLTRAPLLEPAARA